MGHLRSAGGTALWGYAFPPTPNKKGLGRGKDETSQNLSVETPVFSPQPCEASAAEDLRRDGAEGRVALETHSVLILLTGVRADPIRLSSCLEQFCFVHLLRSGEAHQDEAGSVRPQVLHLLRWKLEEGAPSNSWEKRGHAVHYITNQTTTLRLVATPGQEPQSPNDQANMTKRCSLSLAVFFRLNPNPGGSTEAPGNFK